MSITHVLDISSKSATKECLISGDVVNTTTRISRYSNNLRNLLPSNDVAVMELAAKTLVKLALLPGSKGAESFEFDIKRAFEWLSEESNEGKRLAAVLVLRELAVAMPTFFYQQVSGFFEHIFNAVRDPKPNIREGAGQALRAALVVTSQRENANRPLWYQQCYDQALYCFNGGSGDGTGIGGGGSGGSSGGSSSRDKGVTRDDRVHGALIVLDELLRCSNIAWERRYGALRFLRQAGVQPQQRQQADEHSYYILPRLRATLVGGSSSEKSSAASTSTSLGSGAYFDFEPSKFSTGSTTGNYSSGAGASGAAAGSGAASKPNVAHESSVCRLILTANYEDVCARIMEQRASRNTHIQQTLYSILPRLAALNREVFVRCYLKSTVAYLLAALRGKEKDRSMAYVTLGYIALAVEGEIKRYLPAIMDAIRQTLPPKDPASSSSASASSASSVVAASLSAAASLKSRRVATMDASVFVCLTLLGHAVRSGITKDVIDILDSMMATGLSPALTICFRELAETVPHAKPKIADGLLQMLSAVLMPSLASGGIAPAGSKTSSASSAAGTPKHNLSAHISSLAGFDSSSASAAAAAALQSGASGSASASAVSGGGGVALQSGSADAATIVLALNTLGTFPFESQSLLQFVQRCADHFVTSDAQEVRLEAVQTCSRLLRVALMRAQHEHSQSATLKHTVAHVLERLLVVGIADVDASVRLCVLRSLDECFDDHLAQTEALSALLIALNDEVFEIREVAIVTIGRLSAINPAYVMPCLRKTLVQLLGELEHSGMSRNKEQSARMLDHLIVSAPRLIAAYMQPVLTVLVPKLREPESNPGVILNVLRAIGDLAEVSGGCTEMERWADELLTILLEMLADSGAPEKRGVALWTLGQLVGATGRVVTPYYKYPFLIDILINFLKTEQQR